MKANKALKRLAKIEALISDVTERYSAGTHHIREALHDAKDAVARVKAAVRSQATSETAKTSKAPPKQKRRLSAAGRKAIQEAARRRWTQTRAASANVNRSAKKAPPVRKETAVKKAVVGTPTAKTAKKSAPIKKAAKKAMAKKTAPAAARKTPAPVQKPPAPLPAPAPLRAATKPAAQASSI
jgi:hypothetical protein